MIENLLAQNEGRTVEFKESARSLPNIIKTVIAFANTAGGILVIGIEDKTKKVVGIENVLNEEERLINAISESITPFLIPNIEIQTYRKKELIIIDVPHLAGPFYLKSAGLEKGTYIRSGSTSRIADDQMLEKLRLFSKKIYFDEMPIAGQKIEDLDWECIKKLFTNNNKKITETKAQDLGLVVTHGKNMLPSRGGIILFGKNRIRSFPDAIIRCVRFLGTTKATVLDHSEMTDYPILALDEVINFVRRNTTMGAEFGTIARTDVPQYPPVAIREAVINAIIHADYAQGGASIMIAIFNDRMEITSPGGLPIGMTLERALEGSSYARNRVIARTFRELGIIEQWGSGLQRIIDACTTRGLQKPTFQDFYAEFKVTLYSTKTHAIELDKPQKEFIKHLTTTKKISTSQAASFWDIAPRNARIKLKHLADNGLIKKVGTSAKDPHSKYVLADGITIE